jgi:2-polyprenyl-3-methyl-5-hydroxy-6-metoxy-1,4-benzoquinol methylase
VANLERPFPLGDNSFDVVVCNQVIEHIVDLDAFVTELVRVTRPGGAVVVATPNLASWTNVAALVLGQQAFSQSISQRWHIGNRFARRYRMPFEWSYPLHKHILTYQGLRDLFEVYGMQVTACQGAGYFPLPPSVGRLDRIHAQYLVAVARKPRPA